MYSVYCEVYENRDREVENMNERLSNGISIKYKMIYEELKDAIKKGQFMAGSFLPTEAQLMESYGVSRTTIRKAMALLQEDGIVRICQGRGTEVIEGKVAVPPQDMRVLYDVKELSELFLLDGEKGTSGSIVDVVQADSKIAECLNVETLTEVYRIQRLKYCGETPYDYVVSYVPCTLVPGLDRFSGQAFRLKRCMQDEYQVVSERAEEMFYAVSANFTKANLLHVQVGEPLMVVSHTAFNEGGVIEFTESFLRTDVYRKGLILGGGVGIGLEADRDDEILKN